MALLSPGVQVTVTDKSIYLPSAATTVPLFFIATKYGKSLPNSNTIAQGTIEAGVPRLVTSLRDSVDLYGIPVFYRDAYDQPMHGDCRNEYGLLALNQFLKLGNRAWVIRANIDLDDSTDNLQYLWQQATDKVVNKAKSLFNAYLMNLNESKGTYRTKLGGVPVKPSSFATKDEADVYYNQLRDAQVENVQLESIISEAVKEASTLTSTFGDRYSDIAYSKYNLSKIVAGNFYDVAESGALSYDTVKIGTDVYTYPVYNYSKFVDATSANTDYNVLLSDGAREVTSIKTSVATLPIATPAPGSSIFTGIVGRLHEKLHNHLLGGRVAATTNDTASIVKNTNFIMVADPTKTLPTSTIIDQISFEFNITSMSNILDANGDRTTKWQCAVSVKLTAINSLSPSNNALVGTGTGIIEYDSSLVGNAQVVLKTDVQFTNIVSSSNAYRYTLAMAQFDILKAGTLAIAINSSTSPGTEGQYVASDHTVGAFDINAFASLVRGGMDDYLKTYSWYYSTNPKSVRTAAVSDVLANTGKDSLRRMEIVTKLAQVINDNTSTNLNVDPWFVTSDITSEGYEFNLVLCPGFPELADEMLTLTQRVNQEAFVISDTPMNLSPRDVIRWGSSLDENVVQTSYNIIRSDNRGLIAYYYPHGIVTNLDGYDVMCAASGLALAAMTYSDSVSQVWFAPAGPNRGLLTATTGVGQVGYVSGDLGTSNVTFNRVRLNDGMRDSLYSMCNINPIHDSIQYGILVLGQKTRVALSFNSSLDRIAASRTVMYIRRGLRKMLYRFLMEQNNQVTRKNVVSLATSYLNDIQVKQGLYDFAVLCDDSNNSSDAIDRSELHVAVALKLMKQVEFLYCDITLVRTGDSLTI